MHTRARARAHARAHARTHARIHARSHTRSHTRATHARAQRDCGTRATAVRRAPAARDTPQRARGPQRDAEAARRDWRSSPAARASWPCAARESGRPCPRPWPGRCQSRQAPKAAAAHQRRSPRCFQTRPGVPVSRGPVVSRRPTPRRRR
eukprot:6980674-Prymnesium_polylepis.1